jgi:3-deoxy-manno-octulosonate cytidylyltransferase (CMP-KDO synthetase)
MRDTIEMSKVAVIVPARLESSRFPGKPLVKLLGREMVLHVLDRITSKFPIQDTFVATDSIEISRIVESAGFQSIATGKHLTGTDRLSEANQKIGADLVINIQGDEPAFNPQDVLDSINFLNTGRFSVITGYCELDDWDDFIDPNTIKVAFSKSNRLLYISRAPIPGSKNNSDRRYYRQVCMYGYTKEALEKYSSWERTSFEEVEDHELLRFLEHDIDVGLVPLSNWSIPVDLPSDTKLAEAQIRNKFFMEV